MTKYFLKRLILAFISLLLLMIIVFFLIHATDRFPVEKTGTETEAQYLNRLKSLGLDKSVASQFATWISNIFTGKGFGLVYKDPQESIPHLFFGPLKFTVLITAPAFLISGFLGVILGFTAGYKHGTWVDTLINIFVIFFTAVPSFILAAFALAGGSKLGLPIAFIRPEDGGWKQTIYSLLIPIAILTLTGLATLTYYTRNEVVTILQSNQIQIARSKGLDEWSVFKKYVFRNASIPLAAILIPSYIGLLAGSLVIETFFQVPGSSEVIINSVKDAEFNVVMFNTMFFVTLGLVTAIFVDIVYVLIDPRIRYGQAGKFKTIQKLKGKFHRKKKMSQINKFEEEGYNG